MSFFLEMALMSIYVAQNHDEVPFICYGFMLEITTLSSKLAKAPLAFLPHAGGRRGELEGLSQAVTIVGHCSCILS